MQRYDSRYDQYARQAADGDGSFSINEQGQIRNRGRIWLPSNDELNNKILADLQNYMFIIHLEGTKMYREAKHQF